MLELEAKTVQKHTTQVNNNYLEQQADTDNHRLLACLQQAGVRIDFDEVVITKLRIDLSLAFVPGTRSYAVRTAVALDGVEQAPYSAIHHFTSPVRASWDSLHSTLAHFHLQKADELELYVGGFDNSVLQQLLGSHRSSSPGTEPDLLRFWSQLAAFRAVNIFPFTSPLELQEANKILNTLTDPLLPTKENILLALPPGQLVYSDDPPPAPTTPDVPDPHNSDLTRLELHHALATMATGSSADSAGITHTRTH